VPHVFSTHLLLASPARDQVPMPPRALTHPPRSLPFWVIDLTHGGVPPPPPAREQLNAHLAFDAELARLVTESDDLVCAEFFW